MNILLNQTNLKKIFSFSFKIDFFSDFLAFVFLVLDFFCLYSSINLGEVHVRRFSSNCINMKSFLTLGRLSEIKANQIKFYNLSPFGKYRDFV